MKTPEDEAFDDLARKQGMWGGGFTAKRQAAMDKVNQEFTEEYIKYRTAFPKGYIAPQQEPVKHWSDCAVHNAPAYPAGPCDCGVAQEPVAWCIKYGGVLLYAEGSLSKKEVEGNFARNFNEGLSEIIPFYTAPPKRPWVGLTDEEIGKQTILAGFNPEWKIEIGMVFSIVRNLEAKLKEKNT